MMPSRPNPERWLWMLAAASLLAASATAQTNVILYLKGGDRLVGTIISEDTNHVVLTTSWATNLPVSQAVIDHREMTPSAAVASVAPPTNAPPVAATAPSLTPTNPVVTAKLTSPTANPVTPAPPKLWKARVEVGTDMLFGAVDRQLYWGKMNFTYARPYQNDPKKFFRSIFDYNVDYGESDGVKSTDRMNASAKVDFDVGRRLYLYNLGTVGYDDIRQIELQYQVGPGVGYHLFVLPKFVMNTELGLNYQGQKRSVGDDVENVYGRAAEDITWKISKHLTFSEKFEIFPNLQESGQFRARFEATLGVPLTTILWLNLTVVDLYDTSPALNVNNNEMQIRSSIGVAF